MLVNFLTSALIGLDLETLVADIMPIKGVLEIND